MKKWNKERFATIWEKLESMIALRSLRARIFLLTLVIGLVPCIAMRHGIVSNYEDLAVEQRTTVVQNQLMILANHLISNNYLSSVCWSARAPRDASTTAASATRTAIL